MQTNPMYLQWMSLAPMFSGIIGVLIGLILGYSLGWL